MKRTVKRSVLCYVFWIKTVGKHPRQILWLTSTYSLFLGDTMFYVGADGLSLRRVVFSQEERDAILNEVHAGHFGRDRMVDKITNRFYWRSITADVGKTVGDLKQ